MASPPAIRSVISSRVFSPLRKSAATAPRISTAKWSPTAIACVTWWVMKITASPRRLASITIRSTWVACLTPERRRRLVEDQHAGAEVDRPRDGERLALAARQAADQPVAVVDAGDAEALRSPSRRSRSPSCGRRP